MTTNHRAAKFAAAALVLSAGSAAIILRPRPAPAAVVERQMPLIEATLQASAADVGWSSVDLTQAAGAIDAALKMLSSADHDHYLREMADRGLTQHQSSLHQRFDQRLQSSAWKQIAATDDALETPAATDAESMLRFLMQTDHLLGCARIVSTDPSKMRVTQGRLSLSAGRYARGLNSTVSGWTAQPWAPPTVNVEIPVTLADGEQASCILTLAPVETPSGNNWWISNLTFIHHSPIGPIPPTF